MSDGDDEDEDNLSDLADELVKTFDLDKKEEDKNDERKNNNKLKIDWILVMLNLMMLRIWKWIIKWKE